MKIVMLACLVLSGLIAQAAVLIVRTMHVYDRFNLSVDYSAFNQAWQQIATGHLDPFQSLMWNGLSSGRETFVAPPFRARQNKGGRSRPAAGPPVRGSLDGPVSGRQHHG